ncbi:MAG: membrane protein insertase YidC [Victivallaceae bacterium]|nr:membrane protein insertase YidC [Victivallaceae bacterium]
MKFDKTVVVVFALGAALIIGWPYICRQMGWIPAEVPTQQEAVEQTEKNATPVTETVEKTAPATPVLTEKTGSESADKLTELLKKYPDIIISNEQLSLKISPAAGSITETTLKKFFKADLTNKITIGGDMPQGALGIFGGQEYKVLDIVSDKLIAPDSYLLERKIAVRNGVIMLTQQWSLAEGYQIKCQVGIKNIGTQSLSLNEVAFSGYALPPLKQLSGDAPRRETHGIDYLTTDNRFDGLDADDEKLLVETDSPIRWFGAGNKYFAGIVKAETPFDELAVKRVKRQDKNDDEKYYIIMASGVYSQVTLSPNTEKQLSFSVYCGPKEYSRLKDFAPQGEDMLHLSWGPLDAIAGWLLRFLVWLNSKCGSYGWSIIILTMIVRMLFWPVTQKANKSMKKMQQLQPLVAELKKKYKDNPQVMNSKVMELYREKHVSPLGGCLPILLQIPVFFALYATLDGAVELRHVGFLWATDLSRPDTIATIFGLAINPLVIAMTLLMAVQQKLTPMSGDPMQKKMMMFMPLIMLIFLYNLPSGLTLYWTVSQTVSIFQLLITQKLDSKNNDTAAVAAQ